MTTHSTSELETPARLRTGDKFDPAVVQGDLQRLSDQFKIEQAAAVKHLERTPEGEARHVTASITSVTSHEHEGIRNFISSLFTVDSHPAPAKGNGRA